jgi:hypothetical protein
MMDERGHNVFALQLYATKRGLFHGIHECPDGAVWENVQNPSASRRQPITDPSI